MADTTFINGTVIEPAWLNEINDATYTTIPAIQTSIANISSTSSTALGDALVGVKRTATGATATTQHAVNENRPLLPSDFGAVGDGTTDDTTALQNWAAASGMKEGQPNIYKVTGQLTFAINQLNFDGKGMVIDASTGTTFTDSSVVYCIGAITATPDLSVSPSAGAVALTFASAHGLTNNDVCIIYNPTNSSWNAARTYYRAGEFFRVNRAPSTTTLQLWSPLYAGYTAANVDVYKLSTNQINLSNLTVIAPSSGSIRPIRIRLATKVRILNVRAYGSEYTGTELDRCYDVEIHGNDLFEQPSSYSDEYGLSIGNCQDVRVIGGAYHGARHAISIGGDDFTGVVPNRNIRIIGATLKNDQASSAPTADIHGNCQDVEYHNCSIYGGGSFGGMDNAYLNCRFYDGPSGLGALIAGGSECMGGVYRVEGCHLTSTPAFSVGQIFGANGVSATVADSHLIVKNCVSNLGSCDTFVRFGMASSSFKANVHIENITFTGSGSLSNICRMVGTGAAGDGDYVIVDNITNAKAGASLYVSASGYGSTVKLRLMKQSGSSSVALNTGATFTSVSPTFRLGYGSKTPNVSGVVDTRAVDSIPLVVSYRLKSASGVTFDIGKANNVAPTTGPTVAVDWFAGVSEI